VAGIPIGGVAVELFHQTLGVEHVNAHADQCPIRLTRHGRWTRRLFLESDDAAPVVNGHHTKLAGFLDGHFNASHRDISTACNVLFQQHTVVHFVDVVAAQNHHIFGAGFVHHADVLVHRIGGAAVPAFVYLLLGRQYVHVFAKAGFKKPPAALHMTNQALGLVLGDHADAA
jgi:hypothetical protein